MRPDRRRRADLPIDRPDPAPVPFDVASDPDARELAAIEAELAAAGERVRADRRANGIDRPRAAFVAELRSRLVAGYATAAAGATAPAPARPPAGRAMSFPWIATSVAARSAAIRPAQRWAVLAVAAAVAIAVLGSASGRFFPASLEAQATEAVGATVVRDGLASALLPGTSLRAGDEIRVDAAGGRRSGSAPGWPGWPVAPICGWTPCPPTGRGSTCSPDGRTTASRCRTAAPTS